jgi:hypothetical protein
MDVNDFETQIFSPSKIRIMKSYYILTIMALSFLVSSNFLNAQDSGRLGFRLAMHLPNWSVKGNDVNTLGPIEPESYTGFQFYLVYETINKHGDLGRSIEFGYTSRGFRSLNDLYGMGEEVKFQLHYLDLMLPAKAHFGSNNAKFRIIISPYASYAVNGKIIAKAFDDEATESFDFEGLSIRRFDWGVVLGAGMSFGLSEGNTLVADVRLNQGLYNLNKGSDAKETKIKNVGLTFGVTAFFGG